MKIILIKGCVDCPHGAQWTLSGEYICSQLRKVNKNPNNPLDNCPLQDTLKVIKNFIKEKINPQQKESE